MFAGNRSWDYELLWENRGHVFGAFRKAAAGALVEEQRKRSAGKRGAVTLSFDELLDSPALLRDEPALALDFLGCLEHVRKSNPVGAQVLEHSVLMGFDWSEICGLVELSERHARRRLLRALALAREFWEQR
jgi:hypothetical protein